MLAPRHMLPPKYSIELEGDARPRRRHSRRLSYHMSPIVVIAASVGGLDPLRQIIAALAVSCTASVFVVRPHPGELPDILEHGGHVPAVFAEDGMAMQTGHVYVAPPDRHILLDVTHMQLSAGPKVHFARSAADSLFISAAETHGDRLSASF
jgi:two-component system, chemotaxis family, protein-glutamate methylesterase/glutaminase